MDNTDNTSANAADNTDGTVPDHLNTTSDTPSLDSNVSESQNATAELPNANVLPGFSRAREMYHDWISSNREAVGPSSIVVNEDHSGDSYNILSRILGGLNNSTNGSGNSTPAEQTVSGTNAAEVPASASAEQALANSSVPTEAGVEGDSSSSQSDSASTSASTGASAAPADSDNDGQIIITVNYAFSDENNPANPNRTGSLVMTIPNVASNRTPGVIDELILLATQLAYSSIVDGMKTQKGITLEKFNSFAVRDSNTLVDKNCSICFDEFQGLSLTDNIKKRSRDDLLDDVKRRKQESPVPSENSVPTNASIPASTPASTSTSSLPSSHSRFSRDSNLQPQYLAEVQTNFLHVPIEIPCGHVFGKSCLCEWFKEHSSCPLCRSSVTATDKAEPTNPELENNETNAEENSEGQNSNTSERSQGTPRVPPGGGNTNERARMQTFTIFSTSTPPSIFPRFPRRVSPLGPRNARDLTIPNSNSREGGDSPRSSDPESFISSLLSLFRRPPATRPEPLFPTTIGSRRTANGIETTHDDSAREFVNLRSLIDEERNQRFNNTPTSDIAGDDQSSNENNNPETNEDNDGNADTT